MIKVMITDDHGIIRDGISSMLQNLEDIRVICTAGSGEEAISLVDEKTPDIILMDIMMAGMTGIEACRWIKEQSPEIKVILISSEMSSDMINAGIESGTDGYLPKDANKATLISAIREVHNGNKYFSQEITNIIVQNLYQKKDKQTRRAKAGSVLSNRETEVLQKIAEGKTNREIAEELFISVKTVESHKVNIQDKLQIKSTAELVKYAIKTGLITIE